MSRSAFIAVVGRPSAGKSTLVNTVCGHKVSIVSPVPQTTRNAVRGIKTDERGQLVFVDTPGFHDSDKKLNKKLRDVVQYSLEDADAVLYVVDATRAAGEEEGKILALLSTVKIPVIIALNKADLVAISRPDHLDELLGFIKADLPAAELFEISALNETGIDPLLQKLFDLAPEGNQWYPAEYYTDQDPAFRIAEIIREQVMNRTREELPHASYIEIDELSLDNAKRQPAFDDIDFDAIEEPYATVPVEAPPAQTADYPLGTPISNTEDSSEEEGVFPDIFDVPEQTPALSGDVQDLWDLPIAKRPKLTVRASILVERESQKGIVIGKGGSLIKIIRLESEKQLRDIFPWRIELDLRVKVNPKWRTDESLLKRIVH